MHLRVERLHHLQLFLLFVQQFVELGFPESLRLLVPVVELREDLLLLPHELRLVVMLLQDWLHMRDIAHGELDRRIVARFGRCYV